MAQSATTVTNPNPTPPTNMSFVGWRPPLDPTQPVADDGVPTKSPASVNEPASLNLNVFAAQTAATGSGTSVAPEGKGNETLFTQTYSSAIYAPIVLTMDGCGPALTQGTMPNPNALSASGAALATAPTLTTVAPNNVAHAVGTTSITLTGTLFTPSARVLIDGVQVSCNYVSATSITVTNAPNLAVAGTRSIVVTNGSGGPASSAITWTFT